MAFQRPISLRQGGAAFAVLTVVFALADLTGLVTTAGPDEPVWAIRLGLAVAAGAITLVSVLALHLMPFRHQVAACWVVLVAAFLLFFHSFDLSYAFILDRAPFLLGLRLQDGFVQGAAMTLFVSLASITAAVLLALVAALGRLSGSGLAFGLATFYVSFFRGTPLLLQVFLIYLGLPQLGLTLDALTAGIIALSLCYGAYTAEIFRAGILSVPSGQRDAGRALGLTDTQTLWLVVLPQALRVIIPPTGNQFIAMLKDSSLVSVMGVWELMYLARTHGRSEFKYMEMLIAAAVIYWVMSICFELLQAKLERHFGKSDRAVLS